LRNAAEIFPVIGPEGVAVGGTNFVGVAAAVPVGFGVGGGSVAVGSAAKVSARAVWMSPGEGVTTWDAHPLMVKAIMKQQARVIVATNRDF